MTTRTNLSQVLEQRLEALLKSLLPEESLEFPAAAFRWEMPKNAQFGDLSNAIAFKLAGRRKSPPPKVAQELAAQLMQALENGALRQWIERIDVISGFLNAHLSKQALEHVLTEVADQGEAYGTAGESGRGRINIEFLSANPTGPLSVAHGRQATVGDILARILSSQGYDVVKEYYLNDEGNQMELLGRSLRARCRQKLGYDETFPEEGYHGEYVIEAAEAFLAKHGREAADLPEDQGLQTFIDFGMEAMLSEIRQDLERYGLHFDQWTSQRWLRTSGRIDRALKSLEERQALYESEGAQWFAATRYGDDKDRVIRKRDGLMTYLTPDIAYHQLKYEQGYDKLVNLWGPDHHGYIARMKAAVTALGFDPAKLDVRIVQLVTLSRHGKPVRMSKRAGNFVTFREVLDEVGVDATRFFFVMRTSDSHLDFDLDLATTQSQENPVYYIQYAHARICSILAKSPDIAPGNPHLLATDEERLLIRALFQYPVVARLCAEAFEPHGLTGYLRKLAEAFHVFYTQNRVITEDEALTAARLGLVRATRRVLANGLGLLGINAPERM